MPLQLLRDTAAPALVHPGEHHVRITSLAPLGVPPSAGLTRRPLLLGRVNAERLLKQLEVVSSQRAEQAVHPRGLLPPPHDPAHSGCPILCAPAPLRSGAAVEQMGWASDVEWRPGSLAG